MSNPSLALLKSRIQYEYNILITLSDPQTGISLGPIFENVVSQEDAPGYHQVIRYPVSFSTLREKLPKYTNIVEWIIDVAFLPWNVKKYYEPQSEYYKYANIIETHLRNVMMPRLKTYYPFVMYPDLDSLTQQQQEEKNKKPSSNIHSDNTTQRLPILKHSDIATYNQNLNYNNSRNALITHNNVNVIAGNSTFPSDLKYKRATLSLGTNNDPISSPNLANDTTVNKSNASHSPTNSLVPQTATSQTADNSLNTNIEKNINEQIKTFMHSNHLQTISSHIDPSRNTSSISDNNLDPSTYLPQLLTNDMLDRRPSSKFKKKIIKRGRPPSIDFPYVQRMRNVVKNITRTALIGVKESVTVALEKLPDKTDHPEYYSQISNPISFEDIKKKVKGRKYKSFDSFQSDILLMINNFKKYFENDPIAIDKINQFQNAYNSISQHELARPDKDYMPEGEFKYPLENAFLNNTKYKIGDWVLISNLNDASKPIIGQIFKIWKDEKDEVWFNACWYFRPEQTVHRVDRLFYKNEVMKTGQYRDHELSDLLGHCYVVHFTRYQRGDPVFENSANDVPLFVCEFRYNENDKIFNKIRTWRACLPEEIRDMEEETKPVLGRKFFKYASPLKHLLPPNATANDPIPEPQMGNPNAPPLLGAVYIGPVYAKDDLGEFSTSLDCPKYIIRPGDPYEEGTIDEEHGLLTVDPSKVSAINQSQPKSNSPIPPPGVQLSTHNSRQHTPKNNGSTSSLKSLKSDHKVKKSSSKISTGLQSLNQIVSQFNKKSFNKLMQQKTNSANIMLTKSNSMKKLTNKTAQEMFFQFSTQKNNLKSVPITSNGTKRGNPSHNISITATNNIGTNIINSTTNITGGNTNINRIHISNNNNHNTGTLPTSNNNNHDSMMLPTKRGRVVLDTPNAFLFPITTKTSGGQIKTNDVNYIHSDIDKCVQRADKGNQKRRLSKEEFRSRKSTKYGEVIWFKGSSLYLSERMINLGNNNISGSPLDTYAHVSKVVNANNNNSKSTDSDDVRFKNLDYQEVIEEIPEQTFGFQSDLSCNLALNSKFDYKIISSPIKINPAYKVIEDIKNEFPSTSIGLRPSSSYMAFKLQK
ncbi:Rsc2p PWA37_002636 [Arxiozyma heterogenica]|uniref:Rsc2p n=1 Tax=Arxiozyma heterogenica TaxID=278026 RepID=UPI002F0323E5